MMPLSIGTSGEKRGYLYVYKQDHNAVMERDERGKILVIRLDMLL